MRLLFALILMTGFFSQPLWADSVELPSYKVDQKKSRLSFRAITEDDVLEGLFDTFDAQIRFDPKKLEDSTVQVQVDTRDVRINEPSLLKDLLSSEWLAAEAFPEARFVSTELSQIPKTDDYYGKGLLTIRGIEQPVDVSFRQLFNDGEHVVVEGYMTIQRKNYGLESSDEKKNAAIKQAVRIDFRLHAKKQN